MKGLYLLKRRDKVFQSCTTLFTTFSHSALCSTLTDGQTMKLVVTKHVINLVYHAIGLRVFLHYVIEM